MIFLPISWESNKGTAMGFFSPDTTVGLNMYLCAYVLLLCPYD